jgi:hypothetical protein
MSKTFSVNQLAFLNSRTGLGGIRPAIDIPAYLAGFPFDRVDVEIGDRAVRESIRAGDVGIGGPARPVVETAQYPGRFLTARLQYVARVVLKLAISPTADPLVCIVRVEPVTDVKVPLGPVDCGAVKLIAPDRFPAGRGRRRRFGFGAREQPESGGAGQEGPGS